MARIADCVQGVMGTPQCFKRAAQSRRALLFELARTLAGSQGELMEVLFHGSDTMVVKKA